MNVPSTPSSDGDGVTSPTVSSMDVQELLDARAIESLMIRYFDRIDALDPMGATQVFTPNATADLMTGKVYQGPEAIGRALSKILVQYRHTSHHISNHHAIIDGDTASALTYIYAFHRFPDDRIWHLWARHADQLARLDGEWRLTERILVPIDSDPPWDAIDSAWYRSHPGRRSHETVRAELSARFEQR